MIIATRRGLIGGQFLRAHRKVLLTVPGFNESRRRDRTLWHYALETSAYRPPPGSLLFQVCVAPRTQPYPWPPMRSF